MHSAVLSWDRFANAQEQRNHAAEFSFIGSAVLQGGRFADAKESSL